MDLFPDIANHVEQAVTVPQRVWAGRRAHLERLLSGKVLGIARPRPRLLRHGAIGGSGHKNGLCPLRDLMDAGARPRHQQGWLKFSIFCGWHDC